MRFSFTRQERYDLLRSWLLVSLAFAFFMTGIGFDMTHLVLLVFSLVTALVTVGIGFLFHELSHKWLANRYGCHAEYKADSLMLLISLVISVFGVFIAAPGAVHISGHADKDENGKISLAGPAANIVLALLFMALFFLLPNVVLSRAAGLGAIINSSLALFNLIPVGIFDGAKVLAWNKVAYGVAVGAAVLLTFLSFVLIQPSLGLF